MILMGSHDHPDRIGPVSTNAHEPDAGTLEPRDKLWMRPIKLMPFLIEFSKILVSLGEYQSSADSMLSDKSEI